VADLADAIHKHFTYWHKHAGVGEAQLSRVILVGGNANMMGLTEYLEAMLGVPVVVGNVWTNIFSFKEYIPDMHHTESLEFATAIGLALRSIIRTA
jgi:Tfp pilus assembly PilM family ATPase